MPTLGEILNKKIGKGGRSKAYVASKLGVSERTIENYMAGNRNPKPSALVQLSQILDFDLSELSEQTVPSGTEREENEQVKNGVKITEKGKVLSHDALLSVLVTEVAGLIATVKGENQELTIKKIYKAAEDVLKLG